MTKFETPSNYAFFHLKYEVPRLCPGTWSGQDPAHNDRVLFGSFTGLGLEVTRDVIAQGEQWVHAK